MDQLTALNLLFNRLNPSTAEELNDVEHLESTLREVFRYNTPGEPRRAVLVDPADNQDLHINTGVVDNGHSQTLTSGAYLIKSQYSPTMYGNSGGFLVAELTETRPASTFVSGHVDDKVGVELLSHDNGYKGIRITLDRLEGSNTTIGFRHDPSRTSESPFYQVNYFSDAEQEERVFWSTMAQVLNLQLTEHDGDNPFANLYMASNHHQTDKEIIEHAPRREIARKDKAYQLTNGEKTVTAATVMQDGALFPSYAIDDQRGHHVFNGVEALHYLRKELNKTEPLLT